MKSNEAIEQIIGKHGSKIVPGGHIQPFQRNPSQVKMFGGDPGQRFIRGWRRTPKGNEEFVLFPSWW